MLTITREQILKIAPRAKGLYLDAFARAGEVLPRFDITSGNRVAHFVAQLAHETGGFAILCESLNYSAERLQAVWPKRFPTLELARQYERSPEKLANFVYGRRNGNADPGDGWKYIGRGFIQLTGRANYEAFGKLLGIDLVGNPDLAIDPKYSLAIAAAYWRSRGCNQAADRNDLRAVTVAINGGLNGLADRYEWLLRAQSIW